jgi:hypothetical protein
LVAFGAKTAVWIVSEPRPEHVSAVAWLNESTAASFYLLKLEAIRIGESPPAPLLTLIVGPSEEAREAGRAKQELAGRHSADVRQSRLHGASRSDANAGLSPSKTLDSPKRCCTRISLAS